MTTFKGVTTPIENQFLKAGMYQITSFKGFEQGLARGDNFENSFASAVYGNGPYSLLHPNAKSEILGQNTDLIA